MNWKHYLSFVFASFFSLLAMAQVPSAFKYQAAARTASAGILADTTFEVRMSILEGSASGTIDYQETHSVTTNQFGLFSLNVGEGQSTTNGQVLDFSDVNWTSGQKWLQVEYRIGLGNFELIGSSQILTVPFANHAQTADSSTTTAQADSAHYAMEAGMADHATNADTATYAGWVQNPNGDVYKMAKVGIGNTNPSTELEVDGMLKINNQGTGVPLLELASERSWSFRQLFTGSSAALELFDNTGNKRFLISTTGNVGVGITAPAAKLDVNGTIRARKTGNNATILHLDNERDWAFKQYGTGATTQLGLESLSTTGIGNKYFIINTTGRVGIGTTAPTHTLSVNGSASKTGGSSWSVFSDARLKEEKGLFHDGLNVVNQLRPIHFVYNGKEDIPQDEEYIGLIAQEVQKVAPYMVDENEKGYLMADYSSMTFVLINAIQELSQEVESLKAEIAKLKK